MSRAIILAIVVAFLLGSSTGLLEAQEVLGPYQKSILDLYYFQTNSSIDGSLIIVGTITTNKLDFTIIPYSDWLAHIVTFGAHTSNASAHHVRFSNSEEIDPQWSAWLPTNTYVKAEVDPVFTGLSGITGVQTQIIGTATTEWHWVQGVCTQIVTNAIVVFP